MSCHHHYNSLHAFSLLHIHLRLPVIVSFTTLLIGSCLAFRLLKVYSTFSFVQYFSAKCSRNLVIQDNSPETKPKLMGRHCSPCADLWRKAQDRRKARPLWHPYYALS